MNTNTVDNAFYVSIRVKDLKRLLKERYVNHEVRKVIEEDIKLAENNRKDYVTYYCYTDKFNPYNGYDMKTQDTILTKAQIKDIIRRLVKKPIAKKRIQINIAGDNEITEGYIIATLPTEKNTKEIVFTKNDMLNAISNYTNYGTNIELTIIGDNEITGEKQDGYIILKQRRNT